MGPVYEAAARSVIDQGLQRREQSEPSACSPQSQRKSTAIELHALRGMIMASLNSSLPFHGHIDHFKRRKRPRNVL